MKWNLTTEEIAGSIVKLKEDTLLAGSPVKKPMRSKVNMDTL